MLEKGSLLITFVFLALLESLFFPLFPHFQAHPDFVVVFLISLVLQMPQRHWWLWVFWAGFCLDFFSGGTWGVFIVSSAFALFVLQLLRILLGTDRIISKVFVSLLSLLFYNVVLILLYVLSGSSFNSSLSVHIVVLRVLVFDAVVFFIAYPVSRAYSAYFYSRKQLELHF